MNVLVYSLFLVLLSCSDDPIQQFQSREGFPDQESWGVNIILTDQDIVRAKVQSGHLKKYNEKEFIMLDSSVYVDFYDKNEIHTSTLTSDVAELGCPSPPSSMLSTAGSSKQYFSDGAFCGVLAKH